MILDLNSKDDVSPIVCDICIVGSGPAAISLALSLNGKPLRVCMLESGGLEKDGRTQNLYQGESVGHLLPSGLAGSRSRFFGGSSNCWAGACTQLDPIDFKQRDWVPHSGWPIGPEVLTPYIAAAQDICLAGPALYDDRLLQGDPVRAFAFSPDTLEMGYWQFAADPRLGKHYHDAFAASPNITVILHATAMNLGANPAGNHVEQITVKSLSGKGAAVKAKAYVLACGGIENARLLLASNDVMPQGLGNANDLVGRFFMEHPVSACATVVPRRAGDPRLDFLNVFHEPRPLHGATVFNALLKPTEAFQRKHRILNSAAFVVDHDAEFTEGLMAAVRQALLERRLPDSPVRDTLSILGDLRNVAKVAYGRYVSYGSARSRLSLKIQAETVPNPDSRVTLSNKRDALGGRRAVLDWRMLPLDRTTIDVVVEEVRREFARLDLADITLDRWMTESSDTFPHDLRGGVHHTGTTKMSAHEKDGVVNADCRMHTVDNLYMAGSSVFPTNSWANPTWTISCLAVRLADHLDRMLRS